MGPRCSFATGCHPPPPPRARGAGRTGRKTNEGYNEGTAISFFNNNCARLAKDLIGILREANQTVPEELHSFSGGGGGGSSRYGGGGGGRGGGFGGGRGGGAGGAGYSGSNTAPLGRSRF